MKIQSRIIGIVTLGILFIVYGYLTAGCGAGNVTFNGVSVTNTPTPPKNPTGQGSLIIPSINYVPNYLPFIQVYCWPVHQDKITTITYKLTENTSSTPLQSIDFTIEEAVSLWQTSCNPYIFLKHVSTTETADIEFHYISSAALLKWVPGHPEIIGFTQTNYIESSRELKHADIYIDQGLKTTGLTACIVHETGHALGITGHSLSPEDIMYPSLHPPAVLTPADINTLRSILRNKSFSK